MQIYDFFMAPLEFFILSRIRREIMAQAAGEVLEIGTGSGANFKYYDYSQITGLTSLDPSHPKITDVNYPVNFVTGSVEEMPFETASFDCVVESLVLCSVDTEKSLSEIKRVLKPGGLFIFIEHVKPSGRITGSLVNRLNPFWKKLANGCNLNRQTDTILMNSGFTDIQIRQKGVFRYGMGRKAE